MVISFTEIGGPFGAFFDLAIAGGDRIITEIEKFTTCPAANECKFNITHYGRNGVNGFRSHWITHGRRINSNDERLNGLGHQIDTGYEKINGPLSSIRFNSYGHSCIKAITIACGAEVVPNDSYIKITHKLIKSAYQGHGYRSIDIDEIHDCVPFSDNYSALSRVEIGADIFNCQRNDLKCIKEHLEVY